MHVVYDRCRLSHVVREGMINFLMCKKLRKAVQQVDRGGVLMVLQVADPYCMCK